MAHFITGIKPNFFPVLFVDILAIYDVGGGDFNQPDINSENDYNNAFWNVDNGVIAG